MVVEVLFVNKQDHLDFHHNKNQQTLYNYLIGFGILLLFLHFPKNLPDLLQLVEDFRCLLNQMRYLVDLLLVG